MKTTIRNFIACFATCIFMYLGISSVQAGEFKVRPQIGVGTLDGEVSRHAGIRLLLDANETKKYGLELTRLSTQSTDFNVIGIVLEDRKFGWFNTSIGTVGYIGQGQGSHNYPGIVVNLGWEPMTSRAIKPFITYRIDKIFADTTLDGSSLSAGLAVVF